MKKTILIIAIFALLALTGCTRVDSTERGVVKLCGKVTGVVEPGAAFVFPWFRTIEKVPIKTQLETLEMEAGTQDLQTVDVGVDVNFHFDPAKADALYNKYGMDAISSGIKPKIRETITGLTPQYKAEDLLQKREEIRHRMEIVLSAKLDSADSHIIIDGFSIYKFNFKEKFRLAVEDKQVAEQEAEKEKKVKEKITAIGEQKVIAAQKDSIATITKAKADSIAIVTKLRALQYPSVGNYVKLQMLERWNGTLPQVVPGEHITPFFNLN